MDAHRTDWSPTVESEDLDHILSHTIDLWQEMRGQRLFVTGGTGFFGHWLLESLLWANDILDLNVKILLLSRTPQAFSDKYPQLANHPAVSWIQGDVKNFEFPEGEFPYIIHAASEGNVKLLHEDPQKIFDTIVYGTHHVLEFARTHGARKLLFTSSGAVYGRQPPEMTHIPEDYNGAPDLADPGSAYGEGKRTAELLCNLYAHHYGFESKIARCFAFVGPHLPLDANYAIGNFIRDAIHGGPIIIKGDGTPYRSYLYAADLAIWLWTILFKGQNCRAYNVGSDQAISIRDLAEVVHNAVASGVEIRVLQKKPLDEKPIRYVPSIERMQRELGVISWTLLDQGIKNTYRWAKYNTSRVY